MKLIGLYTQVNICIAKNFDNLFKRTNITVGPAACS